MSVKVLDVDGLVISSDPNRVDIDFVHHYLSSESYWALNIPKRVVEVSIRNSVVVGVYRNGQQVAFARLITDFATFGYLADVFVDPRFRGLGISKRIMEFIMSLDFVPGLRRLLLMTWDAQGLYAQFGFKSLPIPERAMEINRKDLYASSSLV